MYVTSYRTLSVCRLWSTGSATPVLLARQADGRAAQSCSPTARRSTGGGRPHPHSETHGRSPGVDGVRRYFAGTQHGSGLFPLVETREADGIRGQLPFNSVDYTPLLRAALTNLDHWVSQGIPAPASCHPRLEEGTAVSPDSLEATFSALPGVQFPPRTTRAIRLDYGPETALGRTLLLPAIEGETYPPLVSGIDADGNELAGIRLPDLTVPLATHTGWNLRHADIGNTGLVIGITGGWPLTCPSRHWADREATAIRARD